MELRNALASRTQESVQIARKPGCISSIVLARFCVSLLDLCERGRNGSTKLNPQAVRSASDFIRDLSPGSSLVRQVEQPAILVAQLISKRINEIAILDLLTRGPRLSTDAPAAQREDNAGMIIRPNGWLCACSVAKMSMRSTSMNPPQIRAHCSWIRRAFPNALFRR